MICCSYDASSGGLPVKRPGSESENVPVTEMEIVNTFTKLIFGDEIITLQELEIVEGVRSVDANVLRDSHAELGEYLRNMGVREMIQLVSRLRQQMHDDTNTTAESSNKKKSSADPKCSGNNPRPQYLFSAAGFIPQPSTGSNRDW
jgi:hypothetical protein